MKCLVVVAHPLEDSLCNELAEKTVHHLKDKGYSVSVKNLYAEEFDPVLTGPERASYYKSPFYQENVKNDIEQLKQSESLVLIFSYMVVWFSCYPQRLV